MVKPKRSGPPGLGALGGPAVLGSSGVLLLVAVSVARYPAAIQGSGLGLLVTDIALLLCCGGFSIWAWRQQQPSVLGPLATGAQTGLILGTVLVVSHTIETFAPFESRAEQFARGAGSVLLMLGLLSVAGSAAWQRTRSVPLAVIAGLWCGTIAILITLGYALAVNLAFETHVAARLHEPFIESGMSNAGAFVVRNALESASEILVRLPVAEFVLSLNGSLLNA